MYVNNKMAMYDFISLSKQTFLCYSKINYVALSVVKYD